MGAGFRVIDTGIGIAKDDQARMLEPFTQVESGLSRKHEGTGLGLPLCRALIEVHDGTLSLERELGAGPALTVTLTETRISEQPVDPPYPPQALKVRPVVGPPERPSNGDQVGTGPGRRPQPEA